MKKMLMLATTAAMSEQFNKNNILILEEMGYEVHVAGNWKEGNPISDERLEQFKEWLREHHGKWIHIPATRKPYDLKNNFVAYKKVVGLIKEYEYEFIHCHTPIGSVIGRVAAHFTKTKIIYTAHGFHFYKGAPLINWLLYYPVEWFLSYWTDVLITINKEDYERAIGRFHAKIVKYIPGVGIDTKKFSSITVDRMEKRKSLGVQKDEIMLLSVGELIPRKNHEVVLYAIAMLRNKKLFNKLHYFVCGQGPLENHLKNKVEKLGIEEQVRFLGYRSDVSEIYYCSDLFIFMSRQEGLAVALMEAMASGLPIVASRIRGNTDLIIDRANGRLIENNARQLSQVIEELYNSNNLGSQYGQVAKNMIGSYDVSLLRSSIQQIYQTIENVYASSI